MTVVTMVWVQEHVHSVRNAAKAVLSYLAFRAHFDDGTAAWPAMRTIADACGLSVKTVQRSIDQLLDLGLIEPGQQDFSAINPKTGRPVRANRQTVVWNVVCREAGLPTEAHDDPHAMEIRAALKRAKPTKDKMSPLENVGNKPKRHDPDKMSPLISDEPGASGRGDILSRKADKMSPEYTGKHNNPSLPTGELPASGKHEAGEPRTNGTPPSDDVGRQADRLLSTLRRRQTQAGLIADDPTPRDRRAVSRLIREHGGAQVLDDLDHALGDPFWAARLTSGRLFARHYAQIHNQHAVAAREAGDPDRPVRRHAHTWACEHVVAELGLRDRNDIIAGDLLRQACRTAAALNRRDGIEAAA